VLTCGVSKRVSNSSIERPNFLTKRNEQENGHPGGR
jgi:hypothetical protein